MNPPLPQGAQEYLEAIFEMVEEGGRIQQAKIAKRLGVSRSTVSEHIHKLAVQGLIEVDGREIKITSSGIEVATPLVRRHRLAERLLTDILDIPWHRAHEEAHKWEHVISPEVEERILSKTGATTCPHGNPIPGCDPPYERSKLVSLADLDEGRAGTLMLLTEDVELATGVLSYFEDHGLMPGALIVNENKAPDGTLTLKIGATTASLSPSLADNLWLMPADN